MDLLKGPIARSLFLGFIALVLVLVVISIVSGSSAQSSRNAIDEISAHSSLALLSARLRSETLALTELLHLDLIQNDHPDTLRVFIRAREQEMDQLLQQIQASIDPTNVDEKTLVANVEHNLAAFNTQTALVLETHDQEDAFGPRTQEAVDRLFAESRGPLLQAVSDLETYESNQAESTKDRLDRIVGITEKIVLLTSLGVILAITLVLNQVVNRLIKPLELLRQGVERIRAGSLDQTIPITTQDEMGDLAGALNSMSAQLFLSRQQLEEYARTLETQVNERTFEAEQRALQAHTAAQITQAASGTLDLEELLRLSVNLIRERFNLYYVGLFLLDDDRQFARLRAGTGEAGRSMIENLHQLPLDHSSMIGRCMLEMKPEVELDVSELTLRYNNPLLPNTRSEMSLPLITQGEVIGGLTVQSTIPMAFKLSDITILQTMAGQLANVIGNARLYQEVEREKTLAEAASRTKSIFLANMSHEIRTPLNSILGFTALLQKETNLTPTQRENVLIVHRSSEALLSLINNILDLSKIEAGRMTLNEQTFNLPHLLDNLEDLFRLRAVDKGLELKIEISPEAPRFVIADEGKLRQVLINLLGNAVKFTEQGRVLVQVSLATRSVVDDLSLEPVPEAFWLSFSVQDTGPGISAEDLENIFRPFYQAALPRTTYPGTGLGLTISRQYVQLMGGNMQVRSALGQGSTFSFLIPVRTTALVSGTAIPSQQLPGSTSAEVDRGVSEERSGAKPTQKVSKEDWAVLPEGELTRLRQAVLLGDVDQIWQIIQQIQALRPELAEMLMGYANRFDLRGLMAQLPETRPQKDEADDLQA